MGPAQSLLVIAIISLLATGCGIITWLFGLPHGLAILVLLGASIGMGLIKGDK